MAIFSDDEKKKILVGLSKRPTQCPMCEGTKFQLCLVPIQFNYNLDNKENISSENEINLMQNNEDVMLTCMKCGHDIFYNKTSLINMNYEDKNLINQKAINDKLFFEDFDGKLSQRSNNILNSNQ